MSANPVELREAAARYAARKDAFAAGKDGICLDLAAKLERYGSFASHKQADFAAKLVAWSKPRPPSERGPMNVVKLFGVMQRHADLFAGELKISRKNQDTLCWVLWRDRVVGKLENGFFVLFSANAGENAARIREVIAEFERDPFETAKRYGRESGVCCSCGRDLTNTESIEAGIGPICAGKFFNEEFA